LIKTDSKNTNTVDVEMSDGGDRTTDRGRPTGKRVRTRRLPTPENEEPMTVSSGEESVEETKAKGKGKGKAAGKSRKKGGDKGEGSKGEVEQDEAVEESESELYQAPTAEVDEMDGICGRALFTYARINIFDPPAEVVFGQWNTRPEVESKARELAKSITDQKFRPFASDSLLPLILDRSAVDPDSIHRTPNVEDAPMLRLTDVALGNGIRLAFAGGRHRRRAAQIIKETSVEKVKKYKEDIADQKKRFDKAREGSHVADSIMKKIRMREAQIAMERDIQNKIAIWGVAVYDRGE
jgi:hypothetical protein